MADPPVPSVWDQVTGHAAAVATLREVVASDRVAHAWLFLGPPGTGKLHVAKVFAAALNCPDGGDGSCDLCRRILRGVHPDVHLIVPEGDNLLVDDIRAVREEASRSHHEARVAVFILDEADRLTDAAANALLKVLEEPQPGVVFVLAARSVEALLGTIPSRSRTLTFASLPPSDIATALAGQLGIDPGQAAWAAAASHGRIARARALLTDEPTRLRRAATLELAEQLASGRASHALSAATAVLAQADEAMAAAKVRQDRELAELDETYGRARGSATLRKRLETRHRRELRRTRFDAIREAAADLLGLYRDLTAIHAGAPEASLVHPDRAAASSRLAASVGPAAAIQAAAALEEADRRLAIGAAPQLTLEAAFLSVQEALRGHQPAMRRMAIRR
jgi:DNA polymerase-3 subunit delta'